MRRNAVFRTTPAPRTPIPGLLAAIVAASWLAAPVAAQAPIIICSYQPEEDDLIGVYTVTTGPSVLHSGGAAIPMPTIDTYQATLAMIDRTLVLFADGRPTVDLHLVGDGEPDWVGLGDTSETPVVDSSDLGMLLECDENSLPRLTGTGIGTSQEGRQFEFTVRLFAASDGMLFGDSSWTIDGMTMIERQVYTEIGG